MPKHSRKTLISSAWVHIHQRDTDDYQPGEIIPIFSLILGNVEQLPCKSDITGHKDVGSCQRVSFYGFLKNFTKTINVISLHFLVLSNLGMLNRD